MLTPHEIAALLLLNNAHIVRQLDPADIDALKSRHLVQHDHGPNNRSQLRLTRRGRQVLATFSRAHA